ncbi:MAG: hypothetical protein ACK6A7_21575 [Planctomycetota bacterium]
MLLGANESLAGVAVLGLDGGTLLFQTGGGELTAGGLDVVPGTDDPGKIGI